MIFGREHELNALHAAYADMLAGHGSVLFLTGEAGLGKTTLVHAWAAGRDTQPAAANNNPSALFLESACSIPIGNVDVGRLEALQPWADVVAQLHGALSTDATTPETSGNEIAHAPRKIDMRKLMRDAAPAWLWALPFVGEVAHAALVTARLVKSQRGGDEAQSSSTAIPAPYTATNTDPNAIPKEAPLSVRPQDERIFAAANQEQVFQQYVNLLTKIAETSPLVIFLDDLHWADTSSCNLLFYLARQIAGKRILVIATYRRDDAMQANDGKGHAVITVKNEILRYDTGKELALTNLDLVAIRTFLSNKFASYKPDARFEEWLHKLSDGNSLFMTQFVHTLREDGHLDDNGAFVGKYSTVAIPASTIAVVEERTRRLDATTRELLMYATAEGEEFTTYVLEHLSQVKPLELLKNLRDATSLGLITQRGMGRLYANKTTGIFGFSHALFHKALYDSLLDIQKQYLHEQCFQLLNAEWIRLSEIGQRTTTLATKLLMHAEKCDEWTAAADVALAAAQEFWNTYNEEETLSMLARVIAATDVSHDLERRAEALYLRAQVGLLRGRADEAKEDFSASEPLFRKAGLTIRAVDATNGVVRILSETGAYEATLAEGERTLAEATSIGYQVGASVALNTMGTVFAERGNMDEALNYFNRNYTICLAIDNLRGQASALNNMANIMAARGDMETALEYLLRSLDLNASIGNLRGEANTLHNIGLVHCQRMNFDDALLHFHRSLEIETAIGNRLGEATSLNGIGTTHASLGARQQALEYFTRSLAIYRAVGHLYGEAATLINIGEVFAQGQDYKEALSYFERSLSLAVAIDNPYNEAAALLNMGSVLYHLHRLDESRSALLRSLEIAQSISASDLDAQCQELLNLVSAEI